MERNYEDDVGREIIVLDGSGVEDYAGTWVGEMEVLVGNVYEIFAITYSFHKTPDYRIKDENDMDWTIDSRCCKFVNEEYKVNQKVDDKVSTLF